MKHRTVISTTIGLLLLTFSYSYTQNLEVFKMREKTQSQLIQKYFKNNSEIGLTSRTPISAMSVSGRVKLNNGSSLARIVLEDEDGNDFLVFETSSVFTNLREIEFSDVCDETNLLDNVKPLKIKIVLRDAELYLESIGTSNAFSQRTFERKRIAENVANVRLKAKIHAINERNKENGELWVADETPLSKLSYADKKKLAGSEGDDFDTQGYEYYASGIFVMKSEEDNNGHILAKATSNYISDFDWRDRHKTNWITPIKHQGFKDKKTGIGGGACWAFAPTACAEAYANLYFNKKIDIDLSEQNVINCAESGDVTAGGGDTEKTMKLIERGIVKETDLPFQNNQTPCVSFPEDKKTRFGAVGSVIVFSHAAKEESFKKAIINNGPLSTVVLVTNLKNKEKPHNVWAHEMLLVGYGKVRSGMKVRLSDDERYMTIPTSSPHIGKTYWIYKNSYGRNSGVEGYHLIIFDNYTHMGSKAYYFTGSVTMPGYKDSDRICDDRDGDGLYTWFGPKPFNAPSRQAASDGDDTDPDLGILSADGRCTLNPGVKAFVVNTSIDTNSPYMQHIRILSGVTLKVNSTLKSNNKRLTVEKFAVLDVSSSGVLDF